ncbi:MAG: hypothetical protein CFE45_18320, partial [Burkholderiales bacterium PBB5]
MIRVLTLAGAAILLLAHGTQAQTGATGSTPADMLSVQSFFRTPVLNQVRLSPSGRWLAALVTKPGERTKLLGMDVDSQVPAQIVAAYTKYDVSDPAWVNDDLLVFAVDDDTDRSREANWKGRGLVSVQRNGDGQRVLIKREWETEFPATGVAPLEANHRFAAMGAPGTDEVIVAERQYDAKGELRNMRLLALNARTGVRRSLLDDAPPNITSWWFDHKGEARMAASEQDGQSIIFWRETPPASWKELVRDRVLNL